MLNFKSLFIILSISVTSTFADYWQDRYEFIEVEESLAIGGSIQLSDKEIIASHILMKYKLEEYEQGFINPSEFLASQHFFHSRNDIEKSNVFKFIKQIPKGASLHGHDTALVSGEFLYNLTYKENLYGCIVNKRLQLHFFDKINDNSCNWTLISILRKESGFEDFLKSQLTIIVDKPKEAYPDINTVWKAFLDTFTTVTPMILYKPVFKEYFYQALQELYDDNIRYMEFRSTLPSVYELDGHEYSPEEVVSIYKDVTEQFQHSNPDFLGVRIIYAPLRDVTNTTADDYVKIATNLHTLYPDFVAGFDLVGQEDKGKPLTTFIGQLQKLPKDINFFFHAGETNWYGTSTDFNLVDAVLLGTKRIGHGYAITKHPQVSKMVKERGIGIEICPISNQVLELVSDLRNHPGTSLIAENYPVVICNDDPSFWGAKGLSYDWYLAFMGMASKNADIKFLKQLALNSLLYNSLPSIEKNNAISAWKSSWDKFIDTVIASENCCSNYLVKQM